MVVHTIDDLQFGPLEWDWILGDGPLDCKILNIERLPLSPSTQVQGRFKNWVQTLHLGTSENLWGRSPTEVDDEVAIIKFGSTFDEFDEFDRCLDSWCILNGKSSHCLETKLSFHL